MIIAHNMLANNAGRHLGTSTKNLSKTSEKLASGYRINRAADDAAGLAISESMRAQIRGLNRASVNCDDGISLVDTADAAMAEVDSVLKRVRDLCVQAANDTNTSDDRKAMSYEIEALTDEVDNIGDETEFNTIKLLQGNAGIDDSDYDYDDEDFDYTYADEERGRGLGIQEGSNSYEGVIIDLPHIDSQRLGMKRIVISDSDSATRSIRYVDEMLNYVNNERAKMGAYSRRLSYAIEGNDNTSENLQSAESKIRDADMADEMVSYAAYSILQQSGQSMLANANNSTQGILNLLNG